MTNPTKDIFTSGKQLKELTNKELKVLLSFANKELKEWQKFFDKVHKETVKRKE